VKRVPAPVKRHLASDPSMRRDRFVPTIGGLVELVTMCQEEH
jgi:hypothetical protein